jgi:hypothetical protein
MEAATAPAPAHTWPTLAVVNDQSSGVPDQNALDMVKAIEHQVLWDFGPRWGAGAHFVFVPVGHKPPAGAWTIALLDSSDQAGALGYHDLTPEGLPLGKVFAGTDRQYGSNICVTLSHEVLEMLADPWIDLSAYSDDGKFYGWEACDAVEADELGYQAGNGLQVSAFVTPAWFGHGPGDVCYPAGRVTKPFELAPGGYTSLFDPSNGQGWQQVTAQRHPNELPEGVLSPAASEQRPRQDEALRLFRSLPRIGSRRERRIRGRSNWVRSTYELG